MVNINNTVHLLPAPARKPVPLGPKLRLFAQTVFDNMPRSGAGRWPVNLLRKILTWINWMNYVKVC